MPRLSREDLYSLEQYAEKRDAIRRNIMAHKKNRKVPVGPNLTLYFEDEKTMRYQVQEMLRVERIFEAEGIQEELDTYNPLIPEGSNWKATCMLEFADVALRKRRLAELVGVENTIHIQVEGFDPVYAIANEDLERSTADKTSSVHFLRFEFTPEIIQAIRNNAAVRAGVDHEGYPYPPALITDPVRSSLVADFD